MPKKTSEPKIKSTAKAKNKPVVVERTLNASVASVWQAITNPDEIKHWFFELNGFKAKPGCEFKFLVEHEGFKYDHRCCITKVIPRKQLSYTWRFEGYEGDSLVTFELFADAGKTRVRLTHAGLETLPKLPQFAIHRFVEGWTMFIGKELKKFVEKAPAKSK